MYGKWKDSIARCTRLNRLKRSTFFIYLSFINGDSDSAHENTSQEIIPRNKIRFFSNDLQNIETLEISEQKQRFTFFKFSVEIR